MQKITSFTFAFLIGIAAVGLTTLAARAAVILNVDGSGQLTGAQNVNVGGTLYDVTFVDGTCSALFTGCDAVSDFDFNNGASASAAVQALLDQVFIDTGSYFFNSKPELTTGCSSSLECFTILPYAFVSSTSLLISSGSVGTAYEYNNKDNTMDGISLASSIGPTADTTLMSITTFALFTPTSPAAIPEPTTLFLFGMGLATLVEIKRRGRQV